MVNDICVDSGQNAHLLTSNDKKSNEHVLKYCFPCGSMAWHPEPVFIQIHQVFNMLNKLSY